MAERRPTPSAAKAPKTDSGTPAADVAPATGADDSPAIRAQLAALANKGAAQWLEAGRALVLQQDSAAALAVFQAALERFPDDDELHLALAGVRWQRKDHAGAQAALEALLERRPGHVAAAFNLARLHGEQDRPQAAEAVFRNLFERGPQPGDLVLRAAKMFADEGRKEAAARVCESAIGAGSDDPFLHVYAAALQGQLGDFERSRRHYLFALERDPRTLDFGAAYGLASIGRYEDPAHPDLLRFKALLDRPDLSGDARASLLFALGKAHDDLGDHAGAAAFLRQANGLVDNGGWSRRNWRRMVEARLGAPRLPQRTADAGECTPVFVVGAPRSGTTLVAELLGRSPEVRNRGELDWLPHFAEQVARSARPDRELLDRIAAQYLHKLRQGEADARWFIDKQPLNFLHAGLIRALFPQARIVYCRRNERDVALSIWSQHFGSSEYRFAYDFDDISALLNGCSRLMAKAARDAGPPLLEVRYEKLARDPHAVIGRLADELGLARFDSAAPNPARSVIGTASVWQARQPVYTRSIGRWRAYAESVPELLRFADD